MADLENQNSSIPAQDFAADTAPVQSETLDAAISQPDNATPNAQPRDLDSLWKKVTAPTSDVTTQPATTAPGAETAASDKQPVQPAPETEQDAPISNDDNPLAEFESKLPSDEDIDSKTGKYARVPVAIKEDLKAFAAEARKGNEFIEKLGGEAALPVFENLSNALFNADQPPAAAANSVLEAVASVNPPLLAQLAGDVFNDLWKLPDWKPLIDRKLEESFGAGYTAEKLQEIVSWLDAGLFDENEMREQYGLDREVRSPKLVALEKEVAQLRQEREQGTTKEATAAQSRQQFVAEATRISDQFVMETVAEQINPIIEKLGWTANETDPDELKTGKTVFAEMQSAWLEKQFRTSPEFKNIAYLIEQNRAFDQNGNPTTAYQLQIDKIAGKAKANMVRAARSLAPTFTRSFAQTRNAQLANNLQPKQTIAQNNQATALPTIAVPPVAASQNNGSRPAPSEDQLKNFWDTRVAVNPADLAMQQRLANGR